MLSLSLPAQTYYGGGNVGLNAGLFGNTYTEIHAEFGRRWKDAFGLGLAYLWSTADNNNSVVGPDGNTTGSTLNLHAIGLQGRLELGHRWLLSFEAGSIVGAGYTVDGVCTGAYQREFDPYFRTALSFRLGVFTLGISNFIGAPLRFSDSHPDAPLPTTPYCESWDIDNDTIERCVLTLGVSFPRKRK